jgi:hypothetical protein
MAVNAPLMPVLLVQVRFDPKCCWCHDLSGSFGSIGQGCSTVAGDLLQHVYHSYISAELAWSRVGWGSCRTCNSRCWGTGACSVPWCGYLGNATL